MKDKNQNDLDRHHRPDDFSRNQTPTNELQVYTWMDASLKEITNLVKEVHPESRKKGTIFDFAICYQVCTIILRQNFCHYFTTILSESDYTL